jgi:AcrR family transcriptional regulator
MFNIFLNDVQFQEILVTRRADHTREELRDLALSAAKSLACQDGLRGVTIRGIAARIGYSVGTLYNVFEDQSDLIVCLNGSILEDLGAHLQAVPVEEPTMAYLRNLAAAYLTYTQENAKLWSLLFEHRLPEGRDLPPLVLRKAQHPIAHRGKCPFDAASGRSSSPSERNGAYPLGKPSWHRHAFSDRKTGNCHCKHRSGYGEFSLERLSGRSYRKFEASLECFSNPLAGRLSRHFS